MYIAGTWVAVHAAYYEYDKHTLGLRISNIFTKTTKLQVHSTTEKT